MYYSIHLFLLARKTLHNLRSPDMTAHSTAIPVLKKTVVPPISHSTFFKIFVQASQGQKTDGNEQAQEARIVRRHVQDNLFYQHFTIKCWPLKGHSSAFKTHGRSHYMSCYKNSFKITYGFKTIIYYLQNKSSESILKTWILSPSNVTYYVFYYERHYWKRKKNAISQHAETQPALTSNLPKLDLQNWGANLHRYISEFASFPTLPTKINTLQ